MIVIAGLNSKGGDGKTMYTVMLARMIHEYQGQRVICIDTDPQGSLTEYIAGQLPASGKTTAGAIIRPERYKEFVISTASGIDILPSHPDDYQTQEWNPGAFRALVEAIRRDGEYQCAIVDTPGTWNKTVMSVINGVDVLMVPSNIRNRGSTAAVYSLLKLIASVSDEAMKKIVVIPTRTKRTELSRRLEKQFRETLGAVLPGQIWEGSIPESEQLVKAHEYGRLVRPSRIVPHKVPEVLAALGGMMNAVYGARYQEAYSSKISMAEVVIEKVHEDRFDRIGDITEGSQQ
jgi:chromosome partitioning protein